MRFPSTTLVLLCMTQLGCGEARAANPPPDDLAVACSDAPLTAAACERYKLEPDFEGAPVTGPQVQDGELIAGQPNGAGSPR